MHLQHIMLFFQPYFIFILISSSLTIVSSDDDTTTAEPTTTTTPAPKKAPSPIKAVHTGVRQSPGYAAVLRCTIADKNATDITWTKKGSQVKGDSRHTIIKSANSTARSTSLKIKSIEAGDYGTYKCNANISGKNYSASVKLLHRKRESSVRPSETMVKASEKSNATLKCLLPKQATNINWQKNGTQVKTDKSHEIIRSSTDKFRTTTLHIISLEEDDFGSYECIANVSGKNESAYILLAEKKKSPTVKASKSDIKEPLLAKAVLKCHIAKAPSKVSWHKDGKTLKHDKRHKFSKFVKDGKVTAMSMTIENLEAADFGEYKCEAVISGKKHSATIKLEQKKKAD